jgi:anti-sigma factor RsiW
MRCEATRDLLADFLDGRLGVLSRGRVRRHLAACATCAEALREEEELGRRLAAWGDVEPPEAVWLRIRDAVALAPFPERASLVGWGRVREVCLRHAIPYALGVATTALLVIALGLGRAGSATGAPGVVPQAGDSIPAPIGGSGWPAPAAAAPRQSEAPLVEDAGEGLLYRRSPEFWRLIRLLEERNALPADWRDRVLGPEAQPAGYQDRTH